MGVTIEADKVLQSHVKLCKQCQAAQQSVRPTVPAHSPNCAVMESLVADCDCGLAFAERDSASNAKEDELRQLVSYAIHHLSCGDTNNITRMDALRHLQRRLLAIDSAILAEAKDGL